jgi:hypothetical protein
VDVSAKIGVFRIGAHDGVPTPEGVKVGTPVAAAKKAYPALPSADGLTLVPVPGNPKATYQIDVSGGKVDSLEMKYVDSISPAC